jgi:hypothetical protein
MLFPFILGAFSPNLKRFSYMLLKGFLRTTIDLAEVLHDFIIIEFSLFSKYRARWVAFVF